MKKKVFSLVVCTLLITILISFSATAKKCEQNLPPDVPTVEIPENVAKGHWIFIKTITTDPDNDDVYYKYDIDGHDYGWVGPFQSGEEHIEKIMVIIPAGTYTLGVQAKDTKGAESDWSYSLFNVIKPRSVSSPLINLLVRYSNLFQMIKYLLGL